MPEKKEHKEEHKHKEEHPHKKKFKIGLWEVSTIALLILLVASIFTKGFASLSATNVVAITPQEASEKALNWISDYFQAQGQNINVKLINASETNGGIYQFTVRLSSTQGENMVTYYVSKDGKLFFPQVILTEELISKQLAQTTQPQTIPKTDKPLMELFIFSYCPAGRAAETALVPVGKLLSNKADIKVKFFSHMHGQYEKEENIRQECIQSKQPNKFWDYTEALLITYNNNVTSCQKNTDCLNNLTDKIMDTVSIDKSKVHDCIKNEGESLYAKDQQDAVKYSLQYSPSFLINGEYLPNIQRTPDAIKEALCSAFNVQPTECSQQLSSSGSSTSTGGCG